MGMDPVGTMPIWQQERDDFNAECDALQAAAQPETGPKEILESLERQLCSVRTEPMSIVEARLANIVGCLIAVVLHDLNNRPEMMTEDGLIAGLSERGLLPAIPNR